MVTSEEQDWLVGWLVLLGFNSYGHITAVGDAHVFPGILTPVLTRLFFPKPPTTFPTCSSRGERQKYAWKKVCLNRVWNSQPPGYESDMLTSQPPGWGQRDKKNEHSYLQEDVLNLFLAEYSSYGIDFVTLHKTEKCLPLQN